MYTPRNYERVTQDAIDFADNAIRSGWLFDDYIKVAKEAWVIKHEEMLTQARYQVSKKEK